MHPASGASKRREKDMTRNLKALGLALLAVLALGTMAASTAQAIVGNAQLTIEGGSGFVHGKDETPMQYTRDGRIKTCATGHYKSNTVTSGATSLTITPEYSNCSAAGLPATVTMNGCNYELTFTADPGHTFTAITHIKCPVGKVIETHVYSSHANHTAGVSLCTYHVGPQTNKTEISLTNNAAGGITPKDWITADITIGGLVSTRTSGSELLCGKELDTAGTLHASVELKGTSHIGEARHITMSTKV
jgi:hypothetical protein